MEASVQAQQRFSEQKLNKRRNVSIFPVSSKINFVQFVSLNYFLFCLQFTRVEYSIYHSTVCSVSANFVDFYPTFSMFFLIFSLTRYFPKNSTQEILDEIYPKLYPLDTGKICGAFDLLSIFLNPMQGYELWLDDFINLWNTYHNPSWNEVSSTHQTQLGK